MTAARKPAGRKRVKQIDDRAEQKRLQEEVGEEKNPTVGGRVGESATDALTLTSHQGIAKVGAHGGKFKGTLKEAVESTHMPYKSVEVDEVFFYEPVEIHSRKMNTISKGSLQLPHLKIEFFAEVGLIRLSEPHWEYDYFHGMANVRHMKIFKDGLSKNTKRHIKLN